jgi:hypothetical protein
MKTSKKQRIKELEEKVEELQDRLMNFMEFVGYEDKAYEPSFRSCIIENFNLTVNK